MSTALINCSIGARLHRRSAGILTALALGALCSSAADVRADDTDQNKGRSASETNKKKPGQVETKGTSDASDKTAPDSTETDRRGTKTAPADAGKDEPAETDRSRAKVDTADSAGTGVDDRKQLNELTLPSKVEAARQDVSEELRQVPADKSGPFMANAKVGPGIGFGGAQATVGTQVDLGYAVVKGNGRRFTGGDLYVVISPEFQFGSDVVLTLPLGVQYDIPMPVVGLYVYPRLTAGYSLVLQPGEDEESGNTFALSPAAGIKYVINKAMNIGIEPVVLPIQIGDNLALMQYRMFGYLGLNL